MDLLYMAYYHNPAFRNPILLCSSTDLVAVRYYIEIVRKVPKKSIDIREVIMGSSVAMDMYGDYYLYEYNDDYRYLTDRDISELNKEIDEVINRYEATYKSFGDFIDFASNISKFNLAMNILYEAETVFRDMIGREKNLRRIGKEIMSNSDITSGDIIKYLQRMQIMEEDKELVDLFYRSVAKE